MSVPSDPLTSSPSLVFLMNKSLLTSTYLSFFLSPLSFFPLFLSFPGNIFVQIINSGCKIKALRAKTNTYIKTPVRGEEPVFVVTGRKEDVAAAKREILSAAEHFSQIRAQRKNSLAGGGGGAIGTLTGPGPNSSLPGQTTIQVRVPYRVVGLVVGPKGATIKRIQQQTNTYIITPSRDKEPIFEVTGMPEMVETAKKEIEAHIAMRTGGVVDGSNLNNEDSSLLDNSSDPFARSSPLGSDSLFQQTRSALSSLYKGDSTFNPFSTNSSTRETSPRDIFTFGSKFADIYSSFATSSNNHNNNNVNSTKHWTFPESV